MLDTRTAVLLVTKSCLGELVACRLPGCGVFGQNETDVMGAWGLAGWSELVVLFWYGIRGHVTSFRS